MAPFVEAIKDILIAFCNLPKGISYPMQNKRVLHAVVEFLLQLAKGSLIAFRAIAKGNKIPFRANCMRNLRIACNADNVGNIPLGEPNFKFKNGGKF